MNFFWSCDLSWRSDCEPQLSVKRLDAGTGFVQKRAKKKTTNGVETREAVYMHLGEGERGMDDWDGKEMKEIPRGG